MTEQTPQFHTHQFRPQASDILRSFIGGFLGISGLALSLQLVLGNADLTLMVGAFGATAVLVYGVPYSPLAQPYNVVFGHLISAAIGVSVFQMVGEANWLSVALAVSLAIAAMQATRSVHPPGGATALIAIIAGPYSGTDQRNTSCAIFRKFWKFQPNAKAACANWKPC